MLFRSIANSVPANFANAGKPVSIAPASNGNGHSDGNDAAKKEQAAEAVAGD